MTIAELIAELEQYPEDAEVRLAIQPSWPLQFDIQGVTSDEEIPDPDVVWITQGAEHPERSDNYGGPYAPGFVYR